MALSLVGITISGRIAAGRQEIAPGYWYATLGDASTNFFASIVTDSNNNIYATGRNGTSSSYLLLSKYSQSGAIIWQERLSGFSGVGSGISLDANDNIYIAGQVTVGSKAELLTAKLSDGGVLQWQKKFTHNTSLTAYGTGIACTSTGTSYSVGTLNYPGPIGGSQDQTIVAYDSSGTKLWNRQFVSSTTDGAEGVAVDSSHNSYVVGSSYLGPSGPNLTIVKVKEDGTQGWAQIIDAPSAISGSAITVDASDNIYVTGFINVPPAGYEIIVAKYTSEGVYQWSRSIGDSLQNIGNDIVTDTAGNVYVVASTGATPESILVIKYNASGTLLWQRSISFPVICNADGITIDSAGDMCIAGSVGSSPRDAFLIKLPADGSLTGTYGDLTYAATSYTSNTPTVNAIAPAIVYNTTSYTPTTPTLVVAGLSMTNTTTPIA